MNGEFKIMVFRPIKVKSGVILCCYLKELTNVNERKNCAFITRSH